MAKNRMGPIRNEMKWMNEWEDEANIWIRNNSRG